MGRRILKFNEAFLPMLLGKRAEYRYWISQDPLPKDTKIISVQPQFAYQSCQEFIFLLESSEWEPMPEGQPYAEIRPIITDLPKGEKRE